jgi:carbon monoxide dehydrogenase subunit G
MPVVNKTVVLPRPPAEVFDYLSDFATTEEWDPGIVQAARTSEGAIGVGSTFDLVSNFLGREIRVTYQITEYERPNRFVIVGDNPRFQGIDTIEISAHGDGTRVDYTADFRMKGLAKVLEPFLGRVFEKLSSEAMDGLEKTLS